MQPAEVDRECFAAFCTLRQLTVTSSNGSVTASGGGGVTSNPQPASFCDGTVVDLVAIPRLTYIFDQWGGDAACVAFSGTSGQLTMNADHACTASFRQPTLRVSVNGSGGTVTSGTPAIQCNSAGGAGCQQPVADALGVSLTALRAPGAPFLGWGGDCNNNTGLTSSLAISGDANCTASFGAAQPVGVNDAGGTTAAIVSLADDESLGDRGTSSCCSGLISLQLSADASQVAFLSGSTNLAAGTPPDPFFQTLHGFVRDRLNSTTERFNADPPQTPLSVSYGTGLIGLSADGRRALYTVGEQPTPPTSYNNFAVGLFDHRTGLHETISVPDPVAGIGPYFSGGAALSANGRFVAYQGPISAAGGGLALRDTCFGAAPQEACVPHSVAISADDWSPKYPQLSADGRFVYFAGQQANPQFVPQQLVVHDRDADGNGVFDEPGGSTAGPAVAAAYSAQQFSIDASGRYVAYIANFGAVLRDTCMGAPAGCVAASSVLDVRADGVTQALGTTAVQLSATARFAALLSRDSLLFGNTILQGTFGIVRDTCLGVPAGCIPANNEVTVRQSDGGRGGAFNTGLSISQDGSEAVITSSRGNYFGNTIQDPSFSDLFAAVTGFPAESGTLPTILALSPTSVPAAARPMPYEVYVTIAGSGFVPGVRVTVNGVARSTVFVSRAKLQVLLDDADLAAPGVLMLRVANPGGGTSTQVSMVVN